MEENKETNIAFYVYATDVTLSKVDKARYIYHIKKNDFVLSAIRDIMSGKHTTEEAFYASTLSDSDVKKRGEYIRVSKKDLSDQEARDIREWVKQLPGRADRKRIIDGAISIKLYELDNGVK